MECSGHLFLLSVKVVNPNNLSPGYQGLNQNSTFAAKKPSKETQWQENKDKVVILEEWFSTSASHWNLLGSLKYYPLNPRD